MYEQQQQSLVKDATNRTTPTAALPSISLRSSTSTPSSSHHPPASALRLSSRPLSEHLSSASMAAAVASPRVRFNLEPMHFEFSDVDDISEDPTTSFKLRDRSPSDPLISLGETIDLRNRYYIPGKTSYFRPIIFFIFIDNKMSRWSGLLMKQNMCQTGDWSTCEVHTFLKWLFKECSPQP